MIFGYRELIFRYREMCLISRYREINSRYPKIATRQKQVTPPPCNTALPHRPLSSTAPAIPAPSETIITTSVNHSVYLLLLISMLWHRQVIFESKGDKLFSSAESRIRTQGVSETQSSADWMPADKPTELSRIKLKTWTRQPVPMISKHSAHLTPLPFGVHTWLWRYTYLLLLISMLWHRQVIFESKGDKLSSSAESRIRTYFVQKYRNLWCWINVLNDINKNSTLR